MKCLNCGWEGNPDDAQACEKCHSPLESYDTPAPTPRVVDYMTKKRRKDTVVQLPPDVAPSLCSRCGYPMSPRMRVCPNCNGSDTFEQVRQKTPKVCPECSAVIDIDDNFCRSCGAEVDNKTLALRNALQDADIDNYRQFSLRPLPGRGEQNESPVVTFTGSNVMLNRSNTDPLNNTISPNQQASIIKEGGKWYMENRSEGYTTFMRVTRRTELRDGDIVILGNRGFEFKL